MIDESTRRAAIRAFNAVADLRCCLNGRGRVKCEAFCSALKDYLEREFDVWVEFSTDCVAIVDKDVVRRVLNA